MAQVTERDVLLKGRVMAGMAFLDEIKPGWTMEIDTDFLDMSDPLFCILGQLFGDFLTGMEMIGEPRVAQFGFDGDGLVTCHELTDVWIDAIKQRHHA